MSFRICAGVALLALMGCQKTGQWTPDPPVIPVLPTLQATMTFTDINGGEIVVRGPVRATDAERAEGLMFRKERLKSNEAMLFVMERTERHSFWMKNTYIPLDMVFVSQEGIIVGTLENVPPHTTESRQVDQPSRFVIELDGGWCAKNRVATNSKVVINIDKMEL